MQGYYINYEIIQLFVFLLTMPVLTLQHVTLDLARDLLFTAN